MSTLPLLRALIASIILAANAAALDADTKAMVEAFLKLPVERMPPQHIDRFLAVKPAELPESLRLKFEARKIELHTLKHIRDTKKRGFVRMPEKDCAAPEETKAGGRKIYIMAGYEEITEDEAQYLSSRTKCTMEELMCEFSLRVVVEKAKKGKKVVFLLHPNDPLMALLAQYRAGGAKGQTNFFGIGGAPTCTR